MELGQNNRKGNDRPQLEADTFVSLSQCLSNHIRPALPTQGRARVTASPSKDLLPVTKTPVRSLMAVPEYVGKTTHPRNSGTTVSCDGVTRHPVEDGFRRHLRQDLPPRGMFQAGSFDDVSRNTYDLMTQIAEYGLCGCRINPHRCLRTSSEIHAADEREVRTFKGVSMSAELFDPTASGRGDVRRALAAVGLGVHGTRGGSPCTLGRTFVIKIL